MTRPLTLEEIKNMTENLMLRHEGMTRTIQGMLPQILETCRLLYAVKETGKKVLSYPSEDYWQAYREALRPFQEEPK